MSTFRSFTEIESWQKARELTKRIYSVSGKNEFSRDFSLKDQIRRASVSIMSNIAEGFERGGNKEFVHFLSLAKGSLGEIRSQLYVASDQRYVIETEFNELMLIANEVGNKIGGLITYLRRSGIKGIKFK